MIINVGVLKEVLDHVPDDFDVEFHDVVNNISYPVLDKVEIDVSEKKLVLKS